jgi:hypothetical protein
MIKKLIAEGAEGRWVSRAKLRHFADKKRCSLEYLWRFYHGIGLTQAKSGNGASADAKFLGVPRWAVRQYITNTILKFIWAPLRNDRWLKAYKGAASARGIIDGAVVQSRSSES